MKKCLLVPPMLLLGPVGGTIVLGKLCLIWLIPFNFYLLEKVIRELKVKDKYEYPSSPWNLSYLIELCIYPLVIQKQNTLPDLQCLIS